MTIISLDCLLDILAKNRKAGQSKEEWKQEVKKRFLPPTLSINSFGGGEMNVISQLTTNLKRGTKEYQTTILVQKGVPFDLLLGTDVLAELGLDVVDGAGQGPMMELLQGKTWESRVDLPKSQLRVDAPSFNPPHSDSVREVAGIQESTTKRTPATCSAAVTSSSTGITMKLLQALRLPARHAKIIKL